MKNVTAKLEVKPRVKRPSWGRESILLIRVLLCTLLLTSSGCETTQIPGNSSLERSGDRATPVMLQDAERAFAAGDHLRVLALLAGAAPTDVPAQRLRARSFMALEDWDGAESALGGIAEWRADDLLLLGEVCARNQDFQCSADAYIQAQHQLGYGDPQLPPDLHDRIWSALSQATAAPPMFTDRYHHAWWLLQENIRQAQSATAQIAAWSDWRGQYPSHPAALQPPTALLAYADYRIPDVGVLLPLSGPYAPAGAAVRDGLIAARLTDTTGDQVALRFYDTAAASLVAIWEQADIDGVDA
ncbi:MAG: penicillin-binding protein activator, partial [Pseudomonadota bacterium]